MKSNRPREATVLNREVQFRRERTGRWIAEIPTLPGTTGSGTTRKDALAELEASALRAIAHKLQHGTDLKVSVPPAEQT